MPRLVLDTMDDASRWSALAADGVTPSTSLALADDQAHVRFGADATSGRISATADALGHTLRRGMPPVDLDEFDELRFWLWSDRVADGSAGKPFFLDVRMGSAAMSLANAANTWQRFLPAPRAGVWDLVRLGLADLPAQVRGAVTQLQLRCTDASTPFVCFLDDVLAVREALVADVDAALLDRLHQRLTMGGNPVAAIFHVPESAAVPALPHIRLANYDVRFAEQASTAQARTDYSGNGFRLRAAPLRYELHYEAAAFAATRQEQARILDFLLGALLPRGELVVNGLPLPLEWVPVEPIDTLGLRPDRALLHFKVVARQESGPSVPAIPPFHQVTVETDQRAPV